MRTLQTVLALAILTSVTGSVSHAQEREAVEILKPSSSIEAVVGTVASLDASEDTAKNEDDASTAQRKATYDAWGARRSFGLAIGEVIIINALVWAHNEYFRGADFTQVIKGILSGDGEFGGGDFSQVNPRSWYETIERGFVYDYSHFNHNNQFAHPYHGSLYFNSGRSNGYGYWPSMGFAIAGSFMWECCGETHPMAISDWVDTSIGGSAIGEMLYRVGSTILDNELSGNERILREVGNGVLNPMRGINRLFGGRAGEVGANPEERRPDHLSNTLTAGVRAIESKTTASNGKFFEESDLTAFFEVDYAYGDGWTGRRQGAFEFFILNFQANFGDKSAIGRLQIRGNLFSSPLRTSEKTDHTFALLQNFDYVNNNAFEFGGQSFSAAILSRWQLSNKLQLRTQVDATALLLGAVNSEYAVLADHYGPGLGGRLGGFLFLNGRQIAALSYRMQWIHALNGSLVRFENGSGSSDADHIIQVLALRGRVPISKTFGIGADAFLYVRDSFFTFELLNDIRQRVPQVRLYGTWDIVY